MKTPLRYQITEYDCGTTSLINAISFIYEREEIPPELIHGVMMYTLDEFGCDGEECKGGISIFSVKFLNHWIKSFAHSKGFIINTELLENNDVDIYSNKVKKCMSNGGAIVARVWLGGEHYVIITKIDHEYAYIFDLYYQDITTYDEDNEVEIIKDRPIECNRKVYLKEFYQIVQWIMD
ncbi:MAG TPA: peptidase C39 [Clostridiales bacterium]|nr:peptidase C39 [Clostridiales bacterium]